MHPRSRRTSVTVLLVGRYIRWRRAFIAPVLDRGSFDSDLGKVFRERRPKPPVVAYVRVSNEKVIRGDEGRAAYLFDEEVSVKPVASSENLEMAPMTT